MSEIGDLYIEAKARLAKEPLIETTMRLLPTQCRSMVHAALVVAYAHGYVAREVDEGVEEMTH